MKPYSLIAAALTLASQLYERFEREGALTASEKEALRDRADRLFSLYEHAPPPPPPEAGS